MKPLHFGWWVCSGRVWLLGLTPSLYSVLATLVDSLSKFTDSLFTSPWIVETVVLVSFTSLATWTTRSWMLGGSDWSVFSLVSTNSEMYLIAFSWVASFLDAANSSWFALCRSLFVVELFPENFDLI